MKILRIVESHVQCLKKKKIAKKMNSRMRFAVPSVLDNSALWSWAWKRVWSTNAGFVRFLNNNRNILKFERDDRLRIELFNIIALNTRYIPEKIPSFFPFINLKKKKKITRPTTDRFRL